MITSLAEAEAILMLVVEVKNLVITLKMVTRTKISANLLETTSN